MSNIKYYITDTETTGLSTSKHEVVEFSIIRCDNRVQLTEFIIAETPWTSSFDALKITGKTLEDLKKGKPKEEVIEKIDKFINEDGLTSAHRCFVGHNVQFDRKFIHALYEKVNKQCPVDLWLDTQALIKEYLKTADLSKVAITKTATGKISTTLHAACDILDIKKLSTAHNSKVDSRNTYLLWHKLVEEKKIDFIPHIKTFVHSIATQQSIDELLEELGDINA